MKKIVILTIMTFVIVIGGLMYVQYEGKRLEAAAYQYTSDALYTPVKDLVVDDIVKVDKGTYDISYHYIGQDEKSYRGQQLGVAL